MSQEAHEIWGDTVQPCASVMWIKPIAIHIARSEEREWVVAYCSVTKLYLRNLRLALHCFPDDPVFTGE